MDKAAGKQLRSDDVRGSTDSQLRWMTSQPPAFASEPQYCVYASDNNDA